AEELHDTKVTVTALLPGATASEFANTSGMDKTDLFQDTTPASVVAKDGYKAMMKGKLNVFSGLSGGQRFQMNILPLLPKKM
ncbi:short-chain dehydrogenase, partial [Enterococcus hirae]